MQFRQEAIDHFLQTFRSAENQIRHFEGCLSLALMQDNHNAQVYVTVSVWKNAEALEKYRQSELFKITWEAAKKGFAEKPVAFSLQGDIRT